MYETQLALQFYYLNTINIIYIINNMNNINEFETEFLGEEWKDTIVGVFELAKNDKELEKHMIDYAKMAIDLNTNVYEILWDLWDMEGEKFLEEEKMSEKIIRKNN